MPVLKEATNLPLCEDLQSVELHIPKHNDDNNELLLETPLLDSPPHIFSFHSHLFHDPFFPSTDINFVHIFQGNNLLVHKCQANECYQ